MEPLKSLILIVGEADPEQLAKPVTCEGEAKVLASWTRSICAGIEYPAFHDTTAVTLPDRLAEEQPGFSGFVRYETEVDLSSNRKTVLEITDAYEGVELFVNGQSADIQIVPFYRYDISKLICDGKNKLAIEVATTLERQMYDVMKDDPRAKMRGLKEPDCGSGITGTVRLYMK